MAEPVPDAVLRKVVETLISPEVQSIGFVLDHVRVTPRRFALVADAIAIGRIGLVFDPERLTRRGGIAGYDPIGNDLVLPDAGIVSDTKQLSYVVHEAVHAGTDMAARRTSLPLEEAAAFIAQIWFMQISGLKPGATQHPSMDVLWQMATVLRNRAEMEPLPVEAEREQVSAAWEAAVQAGYPQIQFEANGI